MFSAYEQVPPYWTVEFEGEMAVVVPRPSSCDECHRTEAPGRMGIQPWMVMKVASYCSSMTKGAEASSLLKKS